MKRSKIIAFVLFSVFSFLFLPASKAQLNEHYSAAVNRRIVEVENNLISWVRLDSNRNWNIIDRMRVMHINGVSIAVINNYKIEWVKAYGWADTTEKRPATPGTLFQAASIGKSINGLAFMKLTQEGKIVLSADINTYLKSWKFPYDTGSHGKKINLAQILSHSAGLTVHGFDGYKWNQPIPGRLQILNGEPPANNPAVRSQAEPGLNFEYSGGGYEISEQIVEDLTGIPYEKFIQRAIFKPLKMNGTFYQSFPPQKTGKMLATAYRADGNSIQCKYHLYPEKACGAGLWSTASDLARFVIAIQRTLKGEKGTIINTQTANLMLTPYLKNSNSGFGFFIDKKGDDFYFQHSGLNEGFSSQYFGSLKDGKGVVVLVNSDNTAFMGEVVNSVATVYGWKNFYPYVPKKIFKPADTILNKYTGHYIFDQADTGPEIIKENGSLYLKDPHSADKWAIYFTSDKDFFMLEAQWANQQFFFDENGKVKGFYILGDNYKVAVSKKEY